MPPDEPSSLRIEAMRSGVTRFTRNGRGLGALDPDTTVITTKDWGWVEGTTGIKFGESGGGPKGVAMAASTLGLGIAGAAIGSVFAFAGQKEASVFGTMTSAFVGFIVGAGSGSLIRFAQKKGY